ncbi:MAG TPA: GspH/FimT family protein [Thermoanaerobaculia bacterium]|nr:GspH/FimT family protein [Thermoanaerobaculia bacterium]
MTSCTAPCRGDRGLTLVELILVLAILLIAALLTWPALINQIYHAKARGRAEEMARHLLVARLEAMKLGRAVVARPDYLRQSLYAFVDDDEDLTFDPGEDLLWVLSGATAAHRDLLLMGPTGAPGSDADPAGSVDGFTAVGGSPARAAVFEADGSVRDPGAFRIADRRQPRRNAFEIRVEPQATARVEVRKYVYDGPSGTGFYSAGGGTWQWY